ncbi:lectin-like domain-containing protein [Candidatus Enterococcus ikei]|uniref:DUF5011 domain-containing protein n=1 Tax=Candidatus Enterococcus ikei TaxID=2815326 RepID=A0ABS3H281_9ENTE|nr:immunoglobulin-like domain-containing protein [Enterococcus sp. DIV0869a]MBO0441284.1 DUF5011 domain-containing protein [Enterococcus sp. DIV0869a]
MKRNLLGKLFLVGAMILSSGIFPVMARANNSEDSNDIDNLFRFNGTAVQLNSNTARLTADKTTQAGALTGKAGLNMKNDFSLDMDVNLGSNEFGADGIGIAFHQDTIGAIGAYGGGLGIRGLKQGIGFELDTFWEAPDDQDPSFGHDQMKGAHAGFVSTDSSKEVLTALSPMQYIARPNGTFKNINIKWQANKNLLTADYDGKHFELKNPDINKSVKYTFTIAAATGRSHNAHTVRINKFDASFTKPKLTANDISVLKNSLFDPFDPKIGLKATDEKDGDITNKIRVTKNDVNTAKAGLYHVTYEVTNSQGETDSKIISVTVNEPTSKPKLTANDISVLKDSLFDPFDPKIGLKATDEKDGDITNKIRVIKNDVNTARKGLYHVTYEVTNSQGATNSKIISVTVNEPTWPEGAPNGWKNFAGKNLKLLKDPKNSLFGDYVFYSKQQAAIYKQFKGLDSFKPGKYRVSVYAKGVSDSIPTLPLKVSLKKKPSSGESRTLLLANPLSSGEKVEKGYYKASADVIISADEVSPLITVENYQGGYIAGIFIEPIK